MRQEQHIGTSPGSWRNIPQVDTQERNSCGENHPLYIASHHHLADERIGRLLEAAADYAALGLLAKTYVERAAMLDRSRVERAEALQGEEITEEQEAEYMRMRAAKLAWRRAIAPATA